MAKLLHIQTSRRGSRSAWQTVADLGVDKTRIRTTTASDAAKAEVRRNIEEVQGTSREKLGFAQV
jgi:hypothetical protein